jgi:diguanylate cyclase (GGDEF)-like protein
MERRRRIAVALMLLAAVAYAVAMVASQGAAYAGWIVSAGGAAACLCAGIGCGAAARTSRDRSRRGWAAVALGLTMWALGNGLGLGQNISGVGSYTRLIDVIYLSAVPVLLYGLTSLLAAQRPQVGLRLILDGLVITGSLFAVSWSTVLGPLVSTHQSALNSVIALAYPITDVMMASVVLLVLSIGAPASRSSLALLSAGFLVTAVGDTAYAMVDGLGEYTGEVINGVWFCSYGLMLLGGIWAATGPVGKAERVDVPRHPLLPYIPLTLAIGTILVKYFRTGQITPVLVVTGSCLIAMVLIRQLLTVRENAALAGQLAATVAELRMREEELRHRAYHDALTGLPNRAMFNVRVEEAIVAGGSVALLYIDLDGFKLVNDQLGHAVGDSLLQVVAERLLGVAGRGQTVARLGGDEFAILLPAVAGASDGTELAGRVVDTIGGITLVDGAPVLVGASVGVALNQPDGRVGELMRAADLAMYTAKIEGKGRYAVIDADLAARGQLADRQQLVGVQFGDAQAWGVESGEAGEIAGAGVQRPQLSPGR